MTAIKPLAWRGLSGWVGLVLALPAVLVAGGVNQCKLRPGLYKERRMLESQYASKVGNDYARHKELADQLTEEIKGIDAEYYRFAYALAEFAVKGDAESLAACRASSAQDPIGRQLAALIWYLHEGRKDPGSFIASLPRTKAQLADFWNLDTVLTHGEPQEPSGLPGIPLPDGLIGKYLAELFILVGRGDPPAIREYFYLYSNADGEYGEFMLDQVARLFKERPELILIDWELFRHYGERLRSSEDVSREDFRSIGVGFRELCREKKYQNCAEVLKIFQ